MAAVKAAGASEAIGCWNGLVAPASETTHAEGPRALFTVTCSWTQTAKMGKMPGPLLPEYGSSRSHWREERFLRTHGSQREF